MEVPYIIFQPQHTFSKIILTVSMLLLCAILVGGSEPTNEVTQIINPIQKDSLVIDKLEKKLKYYELIRKP